MDFMSCNVFRLERVTLGQVRRLDNDDFFYVKEQNGTHPGLIKKS